MGGIKFPEFDKAKDHLDRPIPVAAADPEADGHFSHEGPVWVVSLNNEQTEKLTTVMRAGGGTLALMAGPLWPVVGGAMLSAARIIELTNRVGGNNGVDINGVVGTIGVIVTPKIGMIYGQLIQASRLAVSGRTILDFVVIASGKIPALGSILNIPVVASVLSLVTSGTPLGWAIAGGFGLAIDLLKPEPDPNTHGAVLANRGDAREWESFYLAQLGEDNKVSLLSWQGFFSAQQGGGQGVYANRPVVGPWETWTLIDNHDGTVSFQTIGGHFLCAENGGGRECQANRTNIGNWEKFFLRYLPNGKVAMQTHDQSQFVSVQQDS